MRACVVVGLALAVACMAVAGEEPKARPNQKTGVFVSAELAGEVVKWQLDCGDDGKKTYEMSADVKVTYAEKEGAKQGIRVRPAAGRDFPVREGTVVTKGKFVSAKLDGENVLVTVKPAEGDKDLAVTFPKKLTVMYREEEGKVTVFGIGVPRPPREPKAEK